MKLEVLGYATQGILYNNNILLSIQIIFSRSQFFPPNYQSCLYHPHNNYYGIMQALW